MIRRPQGRPSRHSLPGACLESAGKAAQAAWLAEMFDACSRRPWVSGYFLWDWPTSLYAEAEAAVNDDYCMYAKPGADVVRRAYEELRTRSRD